MITVNFENRYEEITPLARVPTLQDAWEVIENHLNKINFKVYYYRTWNVTPTRRKVDYGSHSEFFLLENDISWEEFES